MPLHSHRGTKAAPSCYLSKPTANRARERKRHGGECRSRYPTGKYDEGARNIIAVASFRLVIVTTPILQCAAQLLAEEWYLI